MPFLRQGKDVLYLGFSSGLSGTYHNGAMAAEELQEEFPEAKVITVDTLCASMGQGLLVDLAVQEKRKGKDIEAVRDFVRETIPHLCHWFTVGGFEPTPPGRAPFRRQGDCGEPAQYQTSAPRG